MAQLEKARLQTLPQKPSVSSVVDCRFLKNWFHLPFAIFSHADMMN